MLKAILIDDEPECLRGLSLDLQVHCPGVKKLVKGVGGPFGFGSLEQLEVFFTGIMQYENEMNEIEIHTVEGDLYYSGLF